MLPAISAETIKYPNPTPMSGLIGKTAKEKKASLIANLPTYAKIYNESFKKLNEIDHDIIGPEQIIYSKNIHLIYGDSFYEKSPQELALLAHRGFNFLAQGRMESLEYQLAHDANKKILAIEKKISEFEAKKGSIQSAASIESRMTKNEQMISRNASIMWASILLLAVYIVLFHIRK